MGEPDKLKAAPPERIETFISHQQTALYEKAKLLGEMISQFRGIQKVNGAEPVLWGTN